MTNPNTGEHMKKLFVLAVVAAAVALGAALVHADGGCCAGKSQSSAKSGCCNDM